MEIVVFNANGEAPAYRQSKRARGRAKARGQIWKGLKRILKKGGVITAQVGSQDKKPKQVENWCKVLEKSFGNVKLSGAYIPSFDCNWNFASSIMK